MELQAEIDRMHAAIGRAVGEWVSVEQAIMVVFHRALVGAHFGPTSAAFYSVVNLRTKLDMTSAALKFRLIGHDELFEEWAVIANKIRERSKARLPMAHYSIGAWAQADPGDAVYLYASIYDANKWPAMTPDNAIRDYKWASSEANRIKALAKKIAVFGGKLTSLPEPPSTSYQLSDGKSRPRSVARLFRKTPRTPRRSSQG